MTVEQIEHYLKSNPPRIKKSSNIAFKKRNPIQGIFIEAPDYGDLKKRNFWRIVVHERAEEYIRSKDLNLSRIFNGDEFFKLTAAK